MADFTNNSGTAVAGRVTANRDQITIASLLKWTAQGKVWACGVGVENAGIDSAAALDDTTPTFALVAPSSTSVYVVPIMVRISTHTEGGAIAYINTAITRAASDCATTLAVTGTAFTAKQNKLAGNTGSPQSSVIYTCTSSALTNADCISVEKAIASDNTTSGTGGALFNEGTTYTRNFLKEDDVYILNGGAGLLVYCYTATTDTKHMPYFVFAELTADDLL